jgi:hypothetical protein
MYISLIRIQEAFVHHVQLEHMVARSSRDRVNAMAGEFAL